MITAKKGDYCVANVSDKDANGDPKGKSKLVLFKVTGVSGSTDEVHGRVEKNPHIKEITVSASPKDIVINLGKKPHPGKVYGFDLTRLYRGSQEHDVFGEIHFFTRPDDKDVASLWNALDTTAERLRKAGLSKLLDLPCIYEVVPKHGKYAGMYHHPKDVEKNPGRISISVGPEVIESASIGNYSYVMMHELGHLAHFQCLHDYPKLNAQWVEMFSRTIGPASVSGERCTEIGQTLLANPEIGLRGVMAEADDELKADVKLILKWLREIKGIKSKEIDLLLLADTKSAVKTFKDAWPRVDILSKGLKPMITEYATVSWRETFAESFALYLGGKKLPPEVVELLEKSLYIIRGVLKNNSK